MHKKKLASALIVGSLSAVLAVGLVGCAQAETVSDGSSSEPAALTGDSSSTSATASTAATTTGMDFEYTDRDLDASYDASAATNITLSGESASVEGEGAAIDGSSVTIAEEGTYVVSGTLEDGQLVVAADDSAKVQIVLDGVDITCSDGSAILVESGDKVFVTLADGSVNRVEDGAVYADTSEDAPDGCIFSASDITFNGSGSIEVIANYADGIVSKDDLIITGGSYTITSVDDAIRGKDCVKICDGSFEISAGGDAIKSTNDTDETRGFVCIDGGSFIIAADDDAVHAETVLRVTDGIIDVTTCREGLEAELVDISGGTIDVTASDDGINAVESGVASGTETTVGEINISGGSIALDVEGDGLDANGSITMSGGTVIVCGPTNDGNGSMDYNLSGTITGGTFIALGSSGMALAFDTSSTQAEVCANVTGSAGDIVEICDADGNVLMGATARENFSMVIASGPDLADGESYSIVVNGATVSTATASFGAEGMMGMGGMPGGGMPGGDMGTMQPGGTPAGDMGGQQPPAMPQGSGSRA